MTVQASWDNEDQTIIRTNFVGAWTWGEAHEAADTMNAMMASVDHTVNLIVDVTHSSRVPQFALKEIRAMLLKRSPNADLTVIVGANSVAASLWTTIAQTYGWLFHNSYTFVDTLEEARAHLAAHR